MRGGILRGPGAAAWTLVSMPRSNHTAPALGVGSSDKDWTIRRECFQRQSEANLDYRSGTVYSKLGSGTKGEESLIAFDRGQSCRKLEGKWEGSHSGSGSRATTVSVASGIRMAKAPVQAWPQDLAEGAHILS